MKVILCDKCKKVLLQSDQVIVASAVNYEIGMNAEINKEGISTSVLIGKHFCGSKCLKEGIQ